MASYVSMGGLPGMYGLPNSAGLASVYIAWVLQQCSVTLTWAVPQVLVVRHSLLPPAMRADPEPGSEFIATALT